MLQIKCQISRIWSKIWYCLSSKGRSCSLSHLKANRFKCLTIIRERASTSLALKWVSSIKKKTQKLIENRLRACSLKDQWQQVLLRIGICFKCRHNQRIGVGVESNNGLARCRSRSNLKSLWTSTYKAHFKLNSPHIKTSKARWKVVRHF